MGRDTLVKMAREEEAWDTEQRVDWQGDKIGVLKKRLNKIIESKRFCS